MIALAKGSAQWWCEQLERKLPNEQERLSAALSDWEREVRRYWLYSVAATVAFLATCWGGVLWCEPTPLRAGCVLVNWGCFLVSLVARMCFWYPRLQTRLRQLRDWNAEILRQFCEAHDRLLHFTDHE